MTNTVHCYTSFSFAYLAKARVLAHTLKKLHPDWIFWAVISDRVPEGFFFNHEVEDFDCVLYIQELGIPNWGSWLFKHNVIEVCTAVKGLALKHILAQGAEKVIYLDPDIAIVNPLDEVEQLLNKYDVLITPHQLTPDTEMRAIVDNEICSLQHGVYNLGFLAVNDSEQGHACANWWSDRLLEFCYDDIPNGLFTDQKWCDLLPCFFSNHHIIQDPGYNVASWNLSQRKLEITTDGRILANGSPLKFYHFTKMGPTGDTMTIRYGIDNLPVYELWAWYRQLVKKNEEKTISSDWWYYSQFENGDTITPEQRTLYRKRTDLQNTFPNPFAVGEGTFHEWLKTTTDSMDTQQEGNHIDISIK